MIEEVKDTDGDAWWMAVEYLANRTVTRKALYFKEQSKVQLFIKERIGNEMLFKDDILRDSLVILLKAYLPQAKRDRNKSTKAEKIYQALLQLKCFLDE